MPQVRNSFQAHKERMHWNCMRSELTCAGTRFHIFHPLNSLTECSVLPGQVKRNVYWFLTGRQHTSQQMEYKNKVPFSRLWKGLCHCSHCPFWGPQKSGSTMVLGDCFDLQQQMSDFYHWGGERAKGGSEPSYIWLWNIARFHRKKK